MQKIKRELTDIEVAQQYGISPVACEMLRERGWTSTGENEWAFSGEWTFSGAKLFMMSQFIRDSIRTLDTPYKGRLSIDNCANLIKVNAPDAECLDIRNCANLTDVDAGNSDIILLQNCAKHLKINSSANTDIVVNSPEFVSIFIDRCKSFIAYNSPHLRDVNVRKAEYIDIGSCPPEKVEELIFVLARALRECHVDSVKINGLNRTKEVNELKIYNTNASKMCQMIGDASLSRGGIVSGPTGVIGMYLSRENMRDFSQLSKASRDNIISIEGANEYLQTGVISKKAVEEMTKSREIKPAESRGM